MSNSSGDRHASIVAFAVTVCLLIVSLIGWHQGFEVGQESHQSKSAEAYQNYSDREIAERCALITDVVSQTECITNTVRDAREQQRAEQDLDAQQEMSEWAKWMLFATISMAAITLFGVVFVWQTLEATRAMAQDTRDMSTDTREIGKAQVQAYIHVRSASIYMRSDTTRAFRVFLSNSGASPAKDCRLTGEVELVERGKSRTQELPRPRLTKRISNIGVGDSTYPHTIHDLGMVDRERDIRKAVTAVSDNPSGYTLFLRGSIYYTTFFNEQYVTDFEFYVTEITSLTAGKSQEMAIVHTNASIRSFSRLGE